MKAPTWLTVAVALVTTTAPTLAGAGASLDAIPEGDDDHPSKQASQATSAVPASVLAGMQDVQSEDTASVLDTVRTALEWQRDAPPASSPHPSHGQQPAWTRGQRLAALDTTEAILSSGGSGASQAIERAQIGTLYQAQIYDAAFVDPVPMASHAQPSEVIEALLAQEGVTPTGSQAERIEALDRLPADLARALTRTIDAYAAFEQATDTAFAGFDPASVQALEDRTADPSPLLENPEAAASAESLASPAASLEQAGIDVAPVISARIGFLAAVGELHAALDESQAGADTKLVDQCPTIAVGGLEDDTYEEDCGLVIDLGGDDTYHNNAGGAQGTPPVVPDQAGEADAAALVDLGGDDVYGDATDPQAGGLNGGAWYGAGVLVNVGGQDNYFASDSGVNGGGMLGLGFLLDADQGNDRYHAGVGHCGEDPLPDIFSGVNLNVGVGRCAPGSGGVNGGGTFGTGFLLDAAGSDEYLAGADIKEACPPTCSITAGTGGVNGGAYFGAGLLFDGDGSDRYHAGTNLTCQAGPQNSTCSIDGGTTGVNGGSSQPGTGLLLDEGTGSDSYQAGVGLDCRTYTCKALGGYQGVNGGASLGVGFLFDASPLGQDEYLAGVDLNCTYECRGGSTGVNGGAVFGAGTLSDAGGDDEFRVGENVSIDPCHRVAGDQRVRSCTIYVGDDGVNGGAGAGTGLLLDTGGEDRYVVGSNIHGVFSCEDFDVRGCSLTATAHAANGGATTGGSGALLDAGVGSDTYATGNNVTCGDGCSAGGAAVNGGGRIYAAGHLVDAAGTDAYLVAHDVDCLTTCAANGVGGVNGGGARTATGSLLDLAGEGDWYKDGLVDCQDCVRLPKEEAGIQFDGDGLVPGGYR